MSVLLFILGICVGSFLNVAIFRARSGESIMGRRSRCRACEEPLGVFDLIPIVSFILLRRRCHKCKAVLSWQYPIVELATGVLFVLFNQKIVWGLSPDLGLHTASVLYLRDLVFISYLILIFVYDLRYMLIPDRFTIPAMILALISNVWLGIIPVWSLLLGGLVLAGFFWLQFLISKGTWVGGGDVRMGALMGFMLGIEQGLLALFLAYLFGAITGVFLIITGRATRKTPVPFGSFLVVGTLIVLFAGGPVIDWYLSLFMPN